MKAISKLKDEARRHEQREEWEKAIKVYLQVLAAADEAGGGESELPLYNRVGDLYVRLGRQRDAVQYYEQAADRYAEAGLYNNAIALCNKALRYVPGRLEVLRRLGQFSASQGFLTDARSYFLEYAEKKFGAGDTEAALIALRDYANISGDAEVRELLGRKLHAQGRTAEGLGELKRAYAMRLGAGESEAAATLRREILRIEPSALDDEPTGGTPPVPPQQVMRPAPVEQLPDLPAAAEPPPSPARPSEPDLVIDTLGAGSDEPLAGTGPTVGLLEGFESTALEAEPISLGGMEQLADLELAAEFDAGLIELPPLEGLEEPAGLELTEEPPLPLLELPEDEPLAELAGPDELATAGDFELPLLGEEEAAEPLPLIGDLPLLEGTEDLRSEPLDPEALEPAEDASPLPLLGEAPPPYIDLRAMVVDDLTGAAGTRFTMDEQVPTGDEEDDFAELLSQFKRKVAENVAPGDAAAHYDLGLAFKDMGLLDEAIGELQVALHAGDMRLKVFEELGLCFLLKKEYGIAEKVLRRALETRYDDEIELLGVYYHLGRACEELGKPDLARDAYERVLALDINFADTSERIARL